MKGDQNHQLREELRESYNKAAQIREAGTMQDWKIQERANFLSMLQKEHKQTLLELGAGPGHDSKFFQEQGLDTVCIDLSPEMVALCRQKGLRAHVMDIADIHLPDDSFDAVYAMNSLLHLTKAEFPAVLQQVDRLLKPDGLFFIGVYGGFDHQGVWEQDTYSPKRFFLFFTDDHLKQEVENVFDILSFNPVIFAPEDAIHFQALIMKKRGSFQRSAVSKKEIIASSLTAS